MNNINQSNYYNSSVLEALLRTDLASFIEKCFMSIDRSQNYVRSWHIEVIADYLQKCERGEITRLIINLPPRSLKSLCATVAFPAWLMGRDPNRRIITVSYAEDLSNKHARDCRSVMDSAWYKDTFRSTRINPNKRTENEFETTKGGYRLSTSIGGTLTGRGGSFIIIDDPLKPQDALSDNKRNNCNQWYDNTLFSRLDNKETGCIIVVMQRVHLDDLVGYVQNNEEWTVLNLPAIAKKPEEYRLLNGKIFTRSVGQVLNPALESRFTLDKIKANIGSYNFSSQYQQEPIPSSGNIINFDWFKYYDTIPEAKRWDKVIQSWDTGMTAHDGSDYSACITIRDIDRQNFYILDVYRAKLDFPSLKKKILEMKEKYQADKVVIEDKGAGMSMIQQLQSECCFYTVAYKPEGSKEDRICAQSALIEAGAVHIPPNARWIDNFRNEVISFPYGRNDDQIDALSQGLHWLKTRPISSLEVL